MYRVGVDIGGTFTDAVLINEETGASDVAKVITTPIDPAVGFMRAVSRLLSQSSVRGDQIGLIVHATTVATNSIIEGDTAPSCFITTRGFRDMLEIGRQIRPSLYDLQFEKAPPLIPRYLCFEVAERVGPSGEILEPLQEDDVRRIAKAIGEGECEAAAVCFLHSYANPTHEQRVKELLEKLCPEVLVTLSSEIAPEFKEYFRGSTAVVNAVIRPRIKSYLTSIAERLHEAGLGGRLLIMRSNGGVYTPESAEVRPVYMVESGPAAGVIAAAHVGARVGYKNVISFDMGGTTAKVCVIEDGTPTITKNYEVGGMAGPREFGTGGGYPIRTPVIDLVEIGAGGGSIAWVDEGGALRVGPRSAGAEPGPACYGQGGINPTVTDANVVLGRLNPSYFLGGEIKLDSAAAWRSIEQHCAEPLDLDVVTAAYSIVEIANMAMINALRLSTIKRGHDPREFVLVAFGGAGPAHANTLAREAEIETVLVPPNPGTTSATGLLVADILHESTFTKLQAIAELDPGTLADEISGKEEDARALLLAEGVASEAMEFEWLAEARYIGQGFELLVPFTIAGLTAPGGLAAVEDAFHMAHQRQYGYSSPDEPVEIVNVTLRAIGNIRRPQAPGRSDSKSAAGGLKGSRPVYFGEVGDYLECDVFERTMLPDAVELRGPIIIEEMDATTVVHPGYLVRVEPQGDLVIRKFST
jgi:N-methylhydantoinase A